MQFNKVLLALIFVFMGCCLESALTARLHHKGRTAFSRIFPLHQRKLSAHGRSAASGALFEVAAPNQQAEEGRGLMKKFMLFKSLFMQEKSEPNNNIIIITQPAPTTTATNTPTTPTTTGTTGATTTTAAGTPTGTNTGRDSKTEDETDDDLPIKSPQLEGVIKELQNSQAEEIVQELIKQNKPKDNRLTKFNTRKNLQNQKPQKRRVRLSKRNQQRRRLKPLQQQQKLNTINRENLLTNMNLTKRPNQHAKNNNNHNDDDEESNNDNNNNNSQHHHNNNNASGILNLNTNIRLQNIMNAFRKQTPIMYNY